jgi:hypothetical protein
MRTWVRNPGSQLVRSGFQLLRYFFGLRTSCEPNQSLNCQKISVGLTTAYSLSLSLSLHTDDSASLTTARVETDPLRVSQGILFEGVEQTTGGGVQPPTPGNSNTEPNLPMPRLNNQVRN